MVDISLIEFKTVRQPQGKPQVTNSWLTNTNSSFGFITSTTTIQKTEVRDVTDKIAAGKYGLDTTYAIIYLYDFLEDPTSRSFLSTYGGKLHNISSANVTILTYFDEYVVSQWNNVQQRGKIQPSIKKDKVKAEILVQKLKSAYNINSLPSLIILKQDENGNEESFVLDAGNYNTDELYNMFKEIIDIINDHCEEDFSAIRNSIQGNTTEIDNGNRFGEYNTDLFIDNLLDENHIHQYDLAAELGVDVRTIYNKRRNNSFTREECLYIGVRYCVPIEQLNSFLRSNGHASLGFDGRDGIIRRAIGNKDDVYDVNDLLIRNGFKGIIKPPKE